jgi:exopolysaccharide production protein ExoZ
MIQALRACAAVSVVISHIVGYELTKKVGLSNPLPHYEVFNAGVDLFFVISGFVMVYASDRFFSQPGGSREFLLRRIIRIVPLYWTMTTIVLVYLLLTYGNLQVVNLSAEAAIASYLFFPYPQADGLITPVHGVGWTLNFEMFFYLCFAVALKFSQRSGVFLLTAALCILVASPTVLSLPLALDYLSNPIVLEFAFGMLIGLAMKSDYRLPAWISIVIVVLATLAILLSYKWSYVHRAAAWGIPSAAMVAALVLVRQPENQRPVLKAPVLLGDASYALYLVHPLAITLPRHLLYRVLHPAAAPLLYGGLLLGIAIAASILVHLAFEAPMTRLLKGALKNLHQTPSLTRNLTSATLE